ncbi:MAG: hypothetical protein NUV93_03340 [Firmicutes bacterium]|jgi:hypothetical protein|nr:hypothetical protein [Bacillota bacterium]
MVSSRSSNLIDVAIVGSSQGTMSLFQRHIGGILSGIARVQCYDASQLDRVEADLYICSAHGEQLQIVKQAGKKPVLGVELTLLPVAIRTLRSIPKSCTLGIVARHRQCANCLFAEIVKAGITEYKMLAGTFDEMSLMPVDRFVASEDKRREIEEYGLRKEFIYIARSIAPNSAAEVINAALELATK